MFTNEVVRSVVLRSNYAAKGLQFGLAIAKRSTVKLSRPEVSRRTLGVAQWPPVATRAEGLRHASKGYRECRHKITHRESDASIGAAGS